MILSKIEMNRSIPAVRKALSDCQSMHSLIMGLFGTTRENSAVLYRIRTCGAGASVYIYSAVPPDESRLVNGMTLTGVRDLTDLIAGLTTGQHISFNILTMPSKKLPSVSGNSRRRVLRTQEERLAWLERKADQNGFAVESVQESSAPRITGNHGAERGGKLYLDVYEYSGIIHITDAELFQRAFQNGIGPGKAYGLGMLLIK